MSVYECVCVRQCVSFSFSYLFTVRCQSCFDIRVLYCFHMEKEGEGRRRKEKEEGRRKEKKRDGDGMKVRHSETLPEKMIEC